MTSKERKEKITNKKILEILDKIDHNLIQDHDELIHVTKQLSDYYENEAPEEVKPLFWPLGYMEPLCMIVDGILAWRRSSCIKCKKQQGYKEYTCNVYSQNEKGISNSIPNEIWANEDAKCPYFEEES